MLFRFFPKESFFLPNAKKRTLSQLVPNLFLSAKNSGVWNSNSSLSSEGPGGAASGLRPEVHEDLQLVLQEIARGVSPQQSVRVNRARPVSSFKRPSFVHNRST